MKKTRVFLFILLITMSIGLWGQGQIIGSFPSMGGGFENETVGTVPTLSSIALGAQSTAWTVNNGSGAGSIVSTGGRSGPYYVSSWSATAARRLQSPTATDQAIANATAYTIQYFYKSNAVASTGQVGVSPSGTGNPGTYVNVLLPNTSGVWTMVTTSATSGTQVSTPRYGIGILRYSGVSTNSIDVDDFVMYLGTADTSAPSTPGTVSISNATQSSLDVSWGAASGGVDGGGYVVVRFASDPGTGNDPNQNGIYAVGNAVATGGTVRYIGTSTSFTDNGLSGGTTYWYKVYTVDKAFNYSSETSNSGTTSTVSNPTITVIGSFNTFTTIVGTPSASQNVAVSGSYLTANIGVSAVTGYEYSTTNADPWTSNLSLASSFNGNVYVRLTGASAGTINGTIQLTSTGATQVDRTLSGTVTSPPPPNAPVATAATSIGNTSFTANWDAVIGATSYRLDVYTMAGGTNTTDLFISEYIEGSSNNKYIEIFNGTGSSVDLSDYKLQLYANGATAPTNDVTLSGTLANGATIVYKNSTAALTLPDGVTAIINAAVNFNGDDAVALYKISTTSFVDIFGWIGTPDPGTEWGTSPLWTINTTLVRKSSVTGGVTVNPIGGDFPTLATEWDYYAQDTATYLGSHTYDDAPVISYVSGYQNLTVNGTSQVVSGLTAGTTYYYVVRAVNANGTSSNSNEITVTTTSTVPVITVTGTFSAFSTPKGTASAAQSVSVTGSNLTANIGVSAVAGYEYSTTGSDPWTTSSLSLAAPFTLYVRLTGASVGTFNGTIQFTSTGATQVDRTVTGTVSAIAPVITNVVQTPATGITSTTTVSVSADVTDTAKSVASVKLQWGTATGVYPNEITMALGSAPTYTTISNIPAQPNGTTVYYRVQATDDDNATTNSPQYSYTVQDPIPDAPVVTDPTLVFSESFTANWNAVPGATGYYLDVYTYTTSPATLTEGFEGYTTAAPPAGWTLSGTGNGSYLLNQVANAHGGTYLAGLNLINGWVQTPQLTNPTTMTFWGKASGTTSNYTVVVETSPDGTNWLNQATYAANGTNTGDVTNTYNQYTVNLNLTGSYYIRWFMSARTGGSLYFDDVLVGYTGQTNEYVIQNLDVLNVTSYEVTGLQPSTTYYYVVRAYNDYGSSENSTQGSITTDDGTVPVELSSFTAVITAQNYVMINWTTQTETNVAGFYIYRNTTNNLEYAFQIPSLIAATNTSQETYYSFIDQEVEPNNTYYYWLQNMDIDGTSEFHGPINVTLTQSEGPITPIIITQTELLDAYPNPFSQSSGTRIHYTLKDAGSVKLEVYNVKGQMIWIQNIVNDKAGDYRIYWNGKDMNGKPVSTGVYYYRMSSGKYTSGKKIVLIK